jgi:hypothetical protein
VEDAVNHSVTRFVKLVFYSKVLNNAGSALGSAFIFFICSDAPLIAKV